MQSDMHEITHCNTSTRGAMGLGIVALCLLCLLLSLLSLAACAGGIGQLGDANSQKGTLVQVQFDPSTPYGEAIRELNEVGLRITLPCRNVVALPAGATGQWVRWEAVEQQTNYDPTDPRLWVTATPTAPPDWSQRVEHLPAVQKILPPASGSCPNHLADATPEPNVAYYIADAHVGEIWRIGFAAGVSYDATIASVNGIGIRLADPCYEQARSHGKSPAWHDMGQQDAFDRSHSLVIALTADTSTLWQQQVGSIPGAKPPVDPVSPACVTATP